ncbi:hypothetical protein [Dyella japonica]|uniref:hypothetical protein n=1 Tax=Dyella japonica TaxID=231455 RepID=UPI0002D7EC4B|nr:hypothetical protein [Dyella japonica]
MNALGMKITPTGVAGLLLACASVAACQHATGQPLNKKAHSSQHADAPPVSPVDAGSSASAWIAAPNDGALRPAASAPMKNMRAGGLVDITTARSASPDPADTMGLPIAAGAMSDESEFGLLIDDTAASTRYVDTPAGASAPTAVSPLPTQKPDVPRAPSMTPAPAQEGMPWRSWETLGPAALVVMVAGLLTFAGYRRAQRDKAKPTQGRVARIGWDGWQYASPSPNASPFFGVDPPELSRGWPIGNVQVESWTEAGHGSLLMKPTTDSRYGLTKPLRPAKVDLSMDDDTFLHWVSGTQTAPPAQPAHEAREANEPPQAWATLLLAQAQAHEQALRAEAMRRETMEREHQQREAQRIEALQREAMEREAAQRELARQEAERLEIERRKAREREALEREALRMEAQRRDSMAAEVLQRDAISEAKKQLTLGYPWKALDALAPALDASLASGEAWTVAGWCWWRVARDNGPNAEDAVTRAIQAFHRAMVADPDAEPMLGGALVRCHLFMADRRQGEARAESLDAALRLMGSSNSARQGDARSALEHARTLYERAMLAATDEQASLLERAQQRLAGLPMANMDADARWLMMTIWQAQARSLQGRAADALLTRAVEVLNQVPEHAPQDMRDQWLARQIDIELSRLQHLKGAACVMRLRQLRDMYAPKLAEARSILPLLSWIQILREWSGMLSDRPAREKLAEAEPLFERMASLSPDDIGSVQFARAYYLRLRSSHEMIGEALETLGQADALLVGAQSPVLFAETVALERAEIALARAPLLDPRERKTALEQAIRFSDGSASMDDGNLARALTCGINARLALLETATPSAGELQSLVALARRLLKAMPYDAQALRLSARCEFVAGNVAVASQLCEAAWDAGCHDADLLRLWHASLANQPTVMTTAAHEPQWKRLNQCMRLSQSTGHTAR